jgi:hypothetical protein
LNNVLAAFKLGVLGEVKLEQHAIWFEVGGWFRVAVAAVGQAEA